MERIEEFVDDRQKSWCIHCARSLAGLKTNDDHVPSKSLLLKPRPHHPPVVTICKERNTSFSLDEQYTVTFLGPVRQRSNRAAPPKPRVASGNLLQLERLFRSESLSCVLTGSTDPEKQPNASAARALADSSALRARIEQSRTEYRTIGGESRLVWQPDIDRIQRVVVKNARGHAYFEHGEPMLDAPARIWVLPLETMSGAERQEFEGLHGEGSLAVARTARQIRTNSL